MRVNGDSVAIHIIAGEVFAKNLKDALKLVYRY